MCESNSLVIVDMASAVPRGIVPRALRQLHSAIIGERAHFVKLSCAHIGARLVAPPMLCYNQAGTGTTARAVGVAVRGIALGLSAARIAARFRVGSMRQLYKV